MAKSLEEIILSVLDSAEAKDLVFASEDIKSAIELFESVQMCLQQLFGESIERGTPEDDVSTELESTFDLLCEQQNSKEGFRVDSVAIAYFKLGQAVGRQQVIRRNLLPMRTMIEDRLLKQKQGNLAGSKKLYVDYVASLLLDDYVNKYPNEYMNKNIKLSQRARRALKAKLQDHFSDGSANYNVVGYVISESGSSKKLSGALDRKINNKSIHGLDKELIDKLQIKFF